MLITNVGVIVQMMQAAATGVSEMKSSEMSDKKLITISKENIDKAEEYAITSAKYFLEKYVNFVFFPCVSLVSFFLA